MKLDIVIAKPRQSPKSQYGTKNSDYNEPLNTGNGHFMTGVKCCLAMIRKFVCVQLTMEGNSFGVFKIKRRAKKVMIFVWSSLNYSQF